ncbi:MAG: ferritin family protein [Anaerocolumna sp.]
MDTLELALSLEFDLETYYTGQAEKNKENSLFVVFTMLAGEEQKHVDILLGKADLFDLNVEDENILSEARGLFKKLANFESDIKELPSQLDSYRMALGMEQKSLNFYKSLHDTAVDEKTKKTYQYLIKQEDIHCTVMEELVKLTTRPEEWVESAEFGLREDY